MYVELHCCVRQIHCCMGGNPLLHGDSTSWMGDSTAEWGTPLLHEVQFTVALEDFAVCMGDLTLA